MTNTQVNKKNTKGFTLLIAIVTTSLLLIVSFVVVNIALKQLVLANAAKESQYAFYNADSGTECAVYWDLQGSTTGAPSEFDLSDTIPPHSIVCNGQPAITTSSQTVNTTPLQHSIIGGTDAATNPDGAGTSIFELDFVKGCAIVRVIKAGGLTTIDSRGYNDCTIGALRRYERGVQLAY